jgi:hypothetical protein
MAGDQKIRTSICCVPEMIICMVGIIGSLLPLFVYSDPFWGVESLTDEKQFADGSPGVLILRVTQDSPAAIAGLQRGDRVLGFNGAPVNENALTFLIVLHSIQPGQTVTIECERAGHPVRLTHIAESPKLDAVVLLDWQPITAPICLSLLLILIVSQFLRPSLLWRPILVTLTGLGIMIAVVVTETNPRGYPYQVIWQSQEALQPIWQSQRAYHQPSKTSHYTIVATLVLLGLVLTILGMIGIYRTKVRGTTAKST